MMKFIILAEEEKERDMVVVVAEADGSGANVTMRDNNYIKSH